MMVKCPGCGAMLENYKEGSNYCEYCGRKISPSDVGKLRNKWQEMEYRYEKVGRILEEEFQGDMTAIVKNRIRNLLKCINSYARTKEDKK